MMKWMIKKNKVFLAMIILLLALLCIGWEISLPYRTPVLVIGTQEIFSDEWQEFLQQQKSAVTVYYTQNYGCTVFDDAFWSTEYDGQTPLDCARNRALDTLIDNCVVLRAAQERDLIENIDLRTLKKEWKGFNKQRESSVSMNSVMYGPIEYSFENYYRHLISNLRNSLEENLIDEDPLIEEAAQEFYGENLNQFTTSGNTHVSGLLVEGSHASAFASLCGTKFKSRKGSWSIMKRTLSGLLSLLIVLTLFTPFSIVFAEEDAATSGIVYYVDAEDGDDNNPGTSPEQAWKSLTKVTATTFQPGDQILLKSGSVWNGEWLWPKGSGVEGAPIKIDKYGGEALPVINGMGVDRGFNYSGAVHLRNQEYWEIRNLEITNDDDFDTDIVLQRPQGDNSYPNKDKTRNGILLIVDGDLLEDDADGIMDHIYIENCYIHDVDGPNDWNDTFTGGIIFNVIGSTIRPNTSFRDLRIANNTIRKVDLLGITGYVDMVRGNYQAAIGPNNLWMRDIYIGHNYMEDIGQGGIDLCDAMNAVVEYNVVDGFLKRYPSFRPTVALYPWKSENAVFQFNEVYNGPSTNADGSPYDMDSALKNVVYQFNYSHNNPCGWMLYMGKNDNDIIRYNISDDGGDFIIKYFLTACTTPTYFLNNVIIYDGARTKFMHRDPFKSMTYFYNNVFYNKSETTTTVWHDTNRYLGNLGQVEFSNNCFYEASGQHSPYEPNDPNKITENPLMLNPGQAPQKNSAGILSGATIWDGYKLQADSPLIDAGIYVPQMGDRDFYGTPLYYGAAPDIGVHEYQQGEQTTPTNFAMQATITTNNSHPSFPVTNIADGIYTQNSRWAAQNSELPIWIDFSWNEDVTINKLILTENIVSGWAGPRIASLELQIPSADGAYTTVHTYNGELGDHKTIVFDPITTSNLRLNITGLTPDSTEHGQGETDPSIVEAELYYAPAETLDPPIPPEPDPSENFLLNVPVTSSSVHQRFPAELVNDGLNTDSSRWAAKDSVLPIWLEFDLQGEKTFNTLVLDENIVAGWATERIAGIELQKAEGDTFTTFYSYEGTIGTSCELTFEDCSAEKIRLVITSLQPDTSANSQGQTDPSLREVALYYKPESTN